MDLSEDKTDIPTSVSLPPGRDKPDKKTADTKRKLQKFATMLNKSHPGNRIGYRFLEYEPIVFGAVPKASESGEVTAAAEKMEREFAARQGVFVNKIDLTNKKGWGPQVWKFYVVPVKDGFELLWVVETKETALTDFYIAQQCFRMSGKSNEAWRLTIAETAAFSEYDLWAQQDREGIERMSLSFVRRKNKWEAIPPTDDYIIFRTSLGLAMDMTRSGGDLKRIDEIKPSFNPHGPAPFGADIDNGLMARTDLDNKWVCALYWERTTHISNHHPADCLHAYVNLGPLAPHSKRAIRGRIYWTRASMDELFKIWQKD